MEGGVGRRFAEVDAAQAQSIGGPRNGPGAAYQRVIVANVRQLGAFGSIPAGFERGVSKDLVLDVEIELLDVWCPVSRVDRGDVRRTRSRSERGSQCRIVAQAAEV